MEYTIEKLLAEKQWKQLNLLEGKESCKRKIEGIRIIEVPEMARYLTGGELLLTSLYVYRDCSAEEFYQYLIAFEEKHTVESFERTGTDQRKREENQITENVLRK